MAEKEEVKGYRQGELLFVPTKDDGSYLNEKLRITSNVIREGEVSGHKHEVVGEAELFNSWNSWGKNQMFLKASNNVQITHPEHKTLNLPKGNYEIIVQREYDELQDRNVMD